jgi:hypothetical protein
MVRIRAKNNALLALVVSPRSSTGEASVGRLFRLGRLSFMGRVALNLLGHFRWTLSVDSPVDV